MKNHFYIYLSLIVLGYFIGRAVERLNSPPQPAGAIVSSKPRVAAPPPQQKFSTITEMKLHDYDKAIELKKELFLQKKESGADTTSLEDELAELTEKSSALARAKGSSFERAHHENNRCWYYLAIGEPARVEESIKAIAEIDPSQTSYLRAWIARYCHQFGYHSEGEEHYRAAILEEQWDLARQYELRLELSRLLIDAESYAEADSELTRLQLELEQATQKGQIVDYLFRLWQAKEDSAKAQGQMEEARRAWAVADRYYKYGRRLR
jgi:hypothetical protein